MAKFIVAHISERRYYGCSIHSKGKAVFQRKIPRSAGNSFCSPIVSLIPWQKFASSNEQMELN